MKQFDITYYYSPTADYFQKEEVVADMAAAGITLCQLWLIEPTSAKVILPLLNKYNMRAVVFDGRLQGLYLNEDREQLDEVVQQVVQDYAEFDNVNAFEICDEPNASKFAIIGEITRALRKYAPDKEVVVNLFPNYAIPAQLEAKDYTDYLERFVKEVNPDFISYDHYHFGGSEQLYQFQIEQAVDERERMILETAAKITEDGESFFENLEEVRRVGLESGREQMLIVLLTEHGPYRNLTRGEIRWEVNMCLAYGMHRISYFTYWLPEGGAGYWLWKNAMCDNKGNKLPHYYDVQAINQEIKEIGERLFQTKSRAVFHIGELAKETVAFTGFDSIRSIEGTDGVIGFFEDGSIYLVNRNYREANRFALVSEKELSIYKNGEFVPYGTEIAVTLDPGAGILFTV